MRGLILVYGLGFGFRSGSGFVAAGFEFRVRAWWG